MHSEEHESYATIPYRLISWCRFGLRARDVFVGLDAEDAALNNADAASV
jgi:hypothetical protein